MLDIFALVVLALWSNSDAKTGQVHNLALGIPVVLAGIFHTTKFLSVFMPIFIFMVMLWLVLSRRGLLGFADVIGIPFTLLFVTDFQFTGIIIFTLVFAWLVFYSANKKRDKVIKKNVYNRIILMPILFLSYFVGFLVHLVISLLG